MNFDPIFNMKFSNSRLQLVSLHSKPLFKKSSLQCSSELIGLKITAGAEVSRNSFGLCSDFQFGHTCDTLKKYIRSKADFVTSHVVWSKCRLGPMIAGHTEGWSLKWSPNRQIVSMTYCPHNSGTLSLLVERSFPAEGGWSLSRIEPRYFEARSFVRKINLLHCAFFICSFSALSSNSQFLWRLDISCKSRRNWICFTTRPLSLSFCSAVQLSCRPYLDGMCPFLLHNG